MGLSRKANLRKGTTNSWDCPAEASSKFRFFALQNVFEYDFLIFKNPNVKTRFNGSAKSGAKENKKLI